jgi:hypothetical protein
LWGNFFTFILQQLIFVFVNSSLKLPHPTDTPPMEGKVNEIIDTTEMVEEIIKIIPYNF